MAHLHQAVSGLQNNQRLSCRVQHVNQDQRCQIRAKIRSNIRSIRMTCRGADCAVSVVLKLSPLWKLGITGIHFNHRQHQQPRSVTVENYFNKKPRNRFSVSMCTISSICSQPLTDDYQGCCYSITFRSFIVSFLQAQRRGSQAGAAFLPLFEL